MDYTPQDLETRSGLPLWVCEMLADPQEESALVAAIRVHLLTEEQRKWLFDADLSVEDLLNGRYTDATEQGVLKLFKTWNEQLNAPGMFGF
jgi:hypothetical protein